MGDAPPLTSVAVKVTLSPIQMLLPEPETILTAGVSAPDTLIDNELEVALVVLTHCELETILHEIVTPDVIVFVL